MKRELTVHHSNKEHVYGQNGHRQAMWITKYFLKIFTFICHPELYAVYIILQIRQCKKILYSITEIIFTQIIDNEYGNISTTGFKMKH